ncbi:MAG: DNA-binding response regulator [Chroococcales cyanobacterium metabat2.561]|nr:MAG: DNA-binding response regulator [Chroococcales cyanobacterium metabat2.561]
MRILLVEDDLKVAAFIRRGLNENNIYVDYAADGLQAELLAGENLYDLIIMDIMLPKMSGLELCRKIRTLDTKTPILLLTALGTTDDKVSGLNAGADDYLVKPFEFRELLARINALTRRTYDLASNTVLEFADLEVNLDAKSVRRNGKDIRLTAREFSLLVYLLRNKGRVISRSEIEERIWGTTFERESNVVDVYINFLRKKIDKDFDPKLIQTIIGMGYVIKLKS